MLPDALDAWLRLTTTPGVGPATARRLLAALGPAESVYAASPATLTHLVGERLAQALLDHGAAADALVRQTLNWCAAEPEHRHVITLADAAYPPALLHTEDPPVLLYVQGRLDALTHARSIAVVGSRHPTPQGVENARHFAHELGKAGVCVVSGLALGIDGAAHEGALDAGALTVAVVGTGLDRVYPRRHHALAHRVAQQGALVSEYPLGTPPLAPHFPRRNRIIAGLAHGTLVVEAALRSGSLITAELALQMGREVFAIPGSIHAPQSRGCHALIRQGALLVESAEDILQDLRHVLGPAEDPPVTTAPSTPTPPADPCPLLQALGFDPADLDTLQARTGWDTAALQARLLELELDGRVQRMPGGRFQRLARA